jgi:hypothetical protein
MREAAAARVLALAIGLALGALHGTAGAQTAASAPAAPAGAYLVDRLLAEVDRHTIAASDTALARALGVFGFDASSGPITREDVERMVEARLLAEEGRRLALAPDLPAIDAAWAEAAARAGGPASLLAWLAAERLSPDWARALVEQDLRRRRFIEERFRAFTFVGETDIDAALGGTGGDPAEREAARSRLTEAAVARGLAEWLVDARGRARIRILLLPGDSVPLVVPMPAARPTTRD